MTFIFGIGSTLTEARLAGQGRRSKVKVKFQNRVLTSLLPCIKVKMKGQGQGQKSVSRSWVEFKGQGQISGAQRSILGARLCRVQQRAIIVITSQRCSSVCL